MGGRRPSPESPVTASVVVSGAVGISEVIADGSAVYWVESRPDEGGRNAVMCWPGNGADHVREITGPEVNVRTRVHEYGGGAWWVESQRLIFADDARQGQLFALDLVSGQEQQLTHGEARYADGRLSSDGSWFVCVRERHDGPAGDEVRNELVAISTNGHEDVRVLIDSFDFVSSPTLGPDDQVVCVAWDHPNMPWDETLLVVVDKSWVEGARPEPVPVPSSVAESIVLPGFRKNGRLLAVTDRSNWWNLADIDISTGEAAPLIEGEFEIATPGWVFGLSRWCEIDAGIVAVIARPSGDEIHFPNGNVEQRHSAVQSIRPLSDGRVAYVASSFQEESAVWVHDGTAATRVSTPRQLGLDDEILQTPEIFRFDSSAVDDTIPAVVGHGLFYPPTSESADLPPLLVLVHGGPTAAARRQLDLSIAYWTSRGVAVAAVDYRGSTLYGREYRSQLRGLWGVADVVDCVAAARSLADAGKVDRSALFIQGGSAGGLTVLNALANYDVFSGGISRYGVTDLRSLATDTHKFESRYLDGLVGRWPQDAERYLERSPVSYPERISAPMLIFQGGQDRVVPEAQAQAMVDALEANGVSVTYRHFPDEGHGFRSAETIVEVLKATEEFLFSL